MSAPLTITNVSVVSMEISNASGLDPIQVFWTDYAPRRGSVTITCYGSAWTCYFGGMSAKSIREFFMGCDSSYLTNKLGISDVLKRGKREEKYLCRVIETVQLALREMREAA